MKTILIILILVFIYQVVVRIMARIIELPAPSFLGPVFDSELRRKLQSPEVLMRRCGVKKDMVVLDLGCGGGAFTTFAARIVGEKGKVYAVDIQKGMLDQLRSKLSKPENQEIKNVEIIQASAGELPFEDNSLDLTFMVGVLGEVPDRKMALKEIYRALKPGGVLAITELLPDPHYRTESTTIKIGEEASFVVDETFGNFLNYTVRFVKKG
jgi:ubiquinone/menaquinone biosynthesis C-methylase UbiE